MHIEFYITIYHTYRLLYFKGQIQMMSNDSIINVETKTIVNKMTKLHLIHLEFTLLYKTTYLLLYCKGHIQMVSNESTINVETKTIQ